MVNFSIADELALARRRSQALHWLVFAAMLGVSTEENRPSDFLEAGIIDLINDSDRVLDNAIKQAIRKIHPSYNI